MKKILGIATKEEIDSIDLIKTKMSCVSQTLKILPEGIKEEQINYYIQSNVDLLGTYQWLEKDWWEQIFKKYKIEKNTNVYIDFDTGELYINEQ